VLLQGTQELDNRSRDPLCRKGLWQRNRQHWLIRLRVAREQARNGCVRLLAGSGRAVLKFRGNGLEECQPGLRQASEDRTCGSRTYKPNSVCRIAPAGRSFLWATHCCGAQATYPKVVTRRAGTYPEPKSRTPSLFGLAPCGVCPARPITATAVRSYRTFSPLPGRRRPGGIFSVVLSVDWA